MPSYDICPRKNAALFPSFVQTMVGRPVMLHPLTRIIIFEVASGMAAACPCNPSNSNSTIHRIAVLIINNLINTLINPYM